MDIPNPQQIQVFQNGVRLVITTDYTVSSGTTVTLVNAASAGDSLVVILFADYQLLDTDALTFTGGTTIEGDLTVDTNTLFVDSTNNRVGVGTASPSNPFQVGTSDLIVDSSGRVSIGGTTVTDVNMLNIQGSGLSSNIGVVLNDTNTSKIYSIQNGGSQLRFFDYSASATRMVIDSSGNLLVGKSSTGIGNTGFEFNPSGYMFATRSGGYTANFNRQTSDGDIVVFNKDGSTVGSIGVVAGNNLYVHGDNIGVGIGDDNLYATNASGAANDNAVDLGDPSVRFNDAFITNGVTTGSDANEKQQIAVLTDAVIAAAKRISAGFKTFKWNDAVEAKGDNARTHTGVIAQEVQTALEAEGLDAGNYAFWMSNTWWETQTEVPVVDEVVDEDGNVITEAKEAYTRTDTYDTLEEAPEGATERTRLGIRYPELLAFIGAATEQRLTSIEARLGALEGN